MPAHSALHCIAELTGGRVSSAVSIRKAAVGDGLAIAALMKAAYASYKARGMNLPDVSAGIDADIRDRIVHVATLEDEIVGALIVDASGGHLHLVNVAVGPAHAGRGIGKALLALADEIASTMGMSEMRLATHIEIPENIALYAHLGWREVGREGQKVIMAKGPAR